MYFYLTDESEYVPYTNGGGTHQHTMALTYLKGFMDSTVIVPSR